MGSFMKDVFGSGQETQQTQSGTSNQTPWSEQIPFLTYGFNQAKDLYGQAVKNPVYQGERVAGLNGFQTSSADSAGNFSNNGWSYANNGLNAGNNLMNTGSQFGTNASDLFRLYSNPNGAQDLGNSYANSDVAKGLIDASSRDVTRNLYENQLPTLAKASAGSGNTNSTRAGVESAIAQRGAADRLADVSSGIRNSFFNQGVNQYNTNLANSLAANNQLYNAYNAGNSGMTNGMNLGRNLFDLGQNAGSMYQTQQQNVDNAALQKFNEQNNNGLDLLTKYMRLVQGNYGGTTTSSGNSTSETIKTPSVASAIGSMMMPFFGMR